MIHHSFERGMTVWIMLRTAPANPDYELVSGVIEEVVSALNTGQTLYRVRIPDGSIAVSQETDCHLDRADLVKQIMETVSLTRLLWDRLEAACAEPKGED